MLNMDESGDEGQPEPEGQAADVQDIDSAGMGQPEIAGQPANTQTVDSAGIGQPETSKQPAVGQAVGGAESDQPVSAGREDNIGVQGGYSLEPAAQGSHGLAQDAEIQPLSVAESDGYGDSGHKTGTEMQQPASTAQNIPGSWEQGQGVNIQPEASQDPDSADMRRPVETPGENAVDAPQRPDMQEIPGCMEARVSIREKLSAIRERRAKEQGHGKGQPQKTGQRKDREAAL